MVGSRHTDGTRVLVTPEHSGRENDVCAVLSRAWACELRRFAKLSPIDWYCVRHERVIGLVELKCQNRASTDRPDVFFAFRKWLALNMGCVGSAVGGVFVAAFTDGVFWIPIQQIDATRLVMGGRRDRGFANDWEPIVLVPVSHMVRVTDSNEG